MLLGLSSLMHLTPSLPLFSSFSLVPGGGTTGVGTTGVSPGGGVGLGLLLLLKEENLGWCSCSSSWGWRNLWDDAAGGESDL